MLFATDIDGTIAGTDHGREYAHYLNRVLDKGTSIVEPIQEAMNNDILSKP